MTSAEDLTITDDYMLEQLKLSRGYSVVLLKRGPNESSPEREGLVWEHDRRNFALRNQGVMPVVLPVRDGSDICGVSVFAKPVNEARRLMDGDPAVAAGIFTYEVHPCRGFPGASLPE